MPAPDNDRHLGEVLRGGGEMGALMRSVDWAATPLGPVAGWPQSLRTALSILLETGFPMYIAWGPEFIQFYNDGYRPILGSTKHPSAMGASTRDTFAEIWDIIGPMFAGVMQGTPTTVVDFLLPLDRHGFVEECYFIYSYSPIRQENGEVGGVLVTVTETTTRVIGERRLKITQDLAARTRAARTVKDVCAIAGEVLTESVADIPFALLYLVDVERGVATLECTAHADAGTSLSPTSVLIGDEIGDAQWQFQAALSGRHPHRVDIPIPERSLANGSAAAQVLPIVQQGSDAPVAILVAGLSPRLMLDDGYRDFLTLVASQIGSAIATARALEEAQARADALAELDRAKTAFFSNVSHEFRTPLTLLLGPTEQAISERRTLTDAELAAVHRNGQRLLKLVNTLLDFSRIEAGRVEAVYEPTDLSALTADLASAFRSAVERAGLQLEVECPPLPEPVYVDRDMWEKVVLNLLSNAFKFTFTGSIRTAIHWERSHVVLTVSDTGVGIPAEHLPHVFDRFSRVERSRARTHEGSGIGLALVRELVLMHGGTIDVDSVVDQGTTFTVSIPTGTAHLDPARIGVDRAAASTAVGATAFVQEALRWLPSGDADSEPAEMLPLDHARVLVADDNADMRDYIARILRERWSVEVVADGTAALAAARRERPDVIVSDVMMPGLDGFQLLQALRADDRLRSVPVILLSARAGQEAEVSGLQSGADDYLVKPFSARELVARVQTQVFRSKVRSVEEMHALRLASIFEHTPVGVAILEGREHVFEFANRAYLGMVGWRSVVGQPVRQALPELAGQGLYELLDQVYASGEPYIGRSVPVRLDRGGEQPDDTFFDFVYQPLFEGARVSGIAVVCFEVTELARARENAEAANRAKDEFLAMLGHELRNPLAPILTALQLMQLRGVQGAERERAVIERQVKHVVGLVDDLLDVSRITRGKVTLRRERLDIADVVAKAIEMTSPLIDERRHALHVDVPRGLETWADPARLAQVLANLLTNAAKYTEPGGTITIAAAAVGEELALTVADTGRGIDPELVPRLFDPFVQGRQESERALGGLGLGLAIVKSIVEAHGGRVAVESAGRGAGTMFTIVLRRHEERHDSAVAPPESVEIERAGVHILVVDDNEDAAGLLADSLRALGHTVQIAHDGPAALAALSTFRPQVALLDLGLPVMDGFELAQRIRREPGFAQIEIIAITGYGQGIDRQRSAESGFDAHLVKPIDVLALNALIHDRVRATP
jgi:signal transduction histidine kinase/DNA-binding response OmpR family regulator